MLFFCINFAEIYKVYSYKVGFFWSEKALRFRLFITTEAITIHFVNKWAKSLQFMTCPFQKKTFMEKD